MGDDYFSGVTPTYTIDTNSNSDYSITLSSDVTDTVTVTDIGASTDMFSGTYVGPSVTFGEYDDTSRKKLRDDGDLPIDIWAKMYNNGVIDDN